eukprot:2230555-Pleurochrysis_carterae.AAC.6
MAAAAARQRSACTSAIDIELPSNMGGARGMLRAQSLARATHAICMLLASTPVSTAVAAAELGRAKNLSSQRVCAAPVEALADVLPTADKVLSNEHAGCWWCDAGVTDAVPASFLPAPSKRGGGGQQSRALVGWEQSLRGQYRDWRRHKYRRRGARWRKRRRR